MIPLLLLIGILSEAGVGGGGGGGWWSILSSIVSKSPRPRDLWTRNNCFALFTLNGKKRYRELINRLT